MINEQMLQDDSAESNGIERAIEPVADDDLQEQPDDNIDGPIPPLKDMMVVAAEAFKLHSKNTVAIEEKRLQILKVRAESRVGERTHAEKLAQGDERLRAQREGTIRWLGSIIVIGFFCFVLSALFLGKIDDPATSLSSMATVVGFLYMLVKSHVGTSKDSGKSKSKSETEEE